MAHPFLTRMSFILVIMSNIQTTEKKKEAPRPEERGGAARLSSN